jgi:drug/metabolite transporter (DMT)-like permease
MSQTVVACILFTLMLLSNAVIFTIVPYISIPSYGFGYHAFQIVFVYSVIATLCMLPWAFKQGISGLKTTRMKAYTLRAFPEYGAYMLSIFSLSYLGDHFTLPMHTALNFITPIIAVVLTIVVLKEKSHSHTWIALALGIIGVLIITRPGMLPASPGVIYVLGAAFGFSFCGIVIKLLSSTESPQHIAFYMLVMTTVLSIPAGISHWQNPTPEGWMWLVIIGVLSYASQILVSKAIAKVPYMVVIPLNFASLIFSTILSYAVYSKLIDHWTLIGATIILAGTLYNTLMNSRQSSRPAAGTTTV